jgi:NAD(P)H-flavin reductase
MATVGTGPDEKNIWRVIKVVSESHDVYTLYLEGFDKKFTGRKAGQYVSLMIMRPDGWSEPHPFTISGPPEEPFLRLTIKKAGTFTSAIPDLEPGTPVKCLGPLGVFCKDIDVKPLIVMTGGGVGVTPFLSVLRHFIHVKSTNKVTLFWANKTFEEVFSSEEIEAMTLELNLKVVHCLSREDDVQRCLKPAYPNVFYEKGRLNGEILKRHGITRDAAYYLCGPPPMMEATLKELVSIDIDPSIVQQEKFSW